MPVDRFCAHISKVLGFVANCRILHYFFCYVIKAKKSNARPSYVILLKNIKNLANLHLTQF